MGVPTVGGEINFDNSYSGNPLVNVMALGLLETDDIVCSGAKKVGSPVLYVGNTTGKDGVGGASFASSELSTTSLDDRPAVQVGDPFIEKSLIEACLDAFKTGDVLAAQDMGAAGITCSSAEMASNGGLGVFVDLDLVPSREKNMTPYDYLLSESQERMLFVVKQDKIDDLISKFKRWGLYACVVGKVIKEKEVIISHKEKIVAQIPTSALSDKTPITHHQIMNNPPLDILNKWKWKEEYLPEIKNNGLFSLKFEKLFSWNDIILHLLSTPSISSKKWVYNQYDYQVQLNTVFKPGQSDAAVIRLRSQHDKVKEKKYTGIAASVDCNNRWVSLDPFRGSIAAVAESSRNVSCVGAKPVAITNNLNFSSPETDIGYWQLALSCKGISKACEMFETPVTGGNVSLFNESKDKNGVITPIQPTPVIGMVGILDDSDKAVSSGWKNIDDEIWIIGSNSSEITLGASSYLEYFHGQVTGRPPEINLEGEKLCQEIIRNSINKDFLVSCHDISDGGLSVALAECSILSGLGAQINIGDNIREDKLLFGEGGSRIIFSIDINKKENWLKYINKLNEKLKDNLYINKIGVVSDNKFKIKYLNKVICDLKVSALADKFNNGIIKNF